MWEDCDGNTPGSKQKCYEDVTDKILAKGRFETGSICTRDQSKDFTCTGCLECADPIHDVCEPRANDEHGRVFSSMTTFPYYEGTLAGGCCQRSPSDDRVAPWEYLNGVPIVLESRTIECTRNTWMPDKTYNKATEKCELPAAAEGPCCAWCDNKQHEHKAWTRKEHMAEEDPARCEWDRFCSGCSECDP